MRLTASKSVGETGMSSVGYVQYGRQNAKSFRVGCGSRIVGGVQVSEDEAVKLALRCDRLVAMWRKAAK